MAARRLILIDGFSLMFRAFYGTGFMSTSDGRPTNALFGFTGMLLSLLTEHKPDALVVCLDPPGKTFRHAEYAEYKGTRRERSTRAPAARRPMSSTSSWNSCANWCAPSICR